MRKLVIKPVEWPCTLAECPPGLFVLDSSLGLKTEYGDMEVYTGGGEIFWGGAANKEDRSNLLVTPATYEWEEEEC